MIRLLLAVGLVTGCDAPREIWDAATRNSQYRAVLDGAIDDAVENIARLEERRRLLLEGFGGVPEYQVVHLVATIDRDLKALVAHQQELRGEVADLTGVVAIESRRCAVHGNWMYREVVATRPTDTPSSSRSSGGLLSKKSSAALQAARRLELWKYPHHGGPTYYSNTQYLPFSRPWICSSCQQARAHWQPKVEEYATGSFSATDTELNLIEAIKTVEYGRRNCHGSLEYEPIEPPFHLAATFTVTPTRGAFTDATFVGSEHALNTRLHQCLASWLHGVYVSHRPAEPVEVVRLPMWTEL